MNRNQRVAGNEQDINSVHNAWKEKGKSEIHGYGAQE